MLKLWPLLHKHLLMVYPVMSKTEVILEYKGGHSVAVLPEYEHNQAHIFDDLKPGDNILVTYQKVGQKRARTKTEQAAIEVYCKQVADMCNAGGITMRELVSRFKKSAELPASQEGVKEGMFKQMMWHCFNLDSTTKLSPTDAHHVWQWCDAFTQQHFNFSVPWPSKKDKDNE